MPPTMTAHKKMKEHRRLIHFILYISCLSCFSRPPSQSPAAFSHLPQVQYIKSICVLPLYFLTFSSIILHFCHTVLFVVLPNPPFLISVASSSSVIPYSVKIPCMNPSPALISTVFPSLLSLVILEKICPSLSE